jgi:glycosyltransferase involved in cell wall biosynthesis
MKIVIYHNWVPKVGGIESAVFNVAKGLSDNGHDVTIAFKGYQLVDSLFRYAEVANVLCVEEDSIKADICLLASNHNIPSTITADHWLQWVHSDYDKYVLKLKNKDLYKEGKLDYIAVSKHAKKVIERREDIKVKEVIYNLMDDDFGNNPEPLRLVTASRLSPEKGFGRMLDFAEVLKEKNVDFVWVMYGDNQARPAEERKWKQAFAHLDEVYFVGFKPDITPMLRNSDYLVQLSDFEGCPYAILEALKMEVPCIVTEWLGVDELITDGKNGYLLPMETKNYTQYVDKIVDNIPKFKYKPFSTIKEWEKILKQE